VDNSGKEAIACHNDCELLLQPEELQCSVCKALNILCLLRPLEVKNLSLYCHVNNRHLHLAELRVKVDLQQKCRRNMIKKIDCLKQKLQKSTEESGIV